MKFSDAKYDVAVVGAGPAGSMAAYNLSKSGLKVVLIEKERLPRYKTCGGGLVYRARKLIPQMNDRIIDREFYEINWGLGHGQMQFKVQRPYPIISMVMREKFDKYLVDLAVNQGTELMENTRLQSVSMNGSALLTTSKGAFNAKIIIGADGALSPTARSIGLDDRRYLIPALEAEVKVDSDMFERYSNTVRFDVDAMPKGYGWVFPKKKHLSIGIASEQRGNINLKGAYNDYLKFLGISNISNQHIHGFQIPISTRKIYTAQGVILVGDAAGLADPLVAEGISHALISGKLAAEAITEGNLKWETIENLYKSKLRNSILSQTRTGKILSRLFYHYPGLREKVLSRKGQRLTEYFTDVFSGTRRYPESLFGIGRAMLKSIF